MTSPTPISGDGAADAYARLAELGAAFGEKSGWERVNWYESNAEAGDESLRPRGWAGQHWSPAIGAEHLVGEMGGLVNIVGTNYLGSGIFAAARK